MEKTYEVASGARPPLYDLVAERSGARRHLQESIAAERMNSHHASDDWAVVETPSYDNAYRAFLHDAAAALTREDETIGKIPMVRDRHAGPIRNVRTETPLDQPMSTASAGMTMPLDVLLQTDVDGHTTMIYEFSQELIREQTRLFYRHLGEMCTAAGTSVQNVGEGVPTIEQLRELFRRMDFSFNERGELSGLQIHVDPSQMERAKALITEAERDPEINDILLVKRAEWMAQRAAASRRTLSR
jgi:hypothetical protein